MSADAPPIFPLNRSRKAVFGSSPGVVRPRRDRQDHPNKGQPPAPSPAPVAARATSSSALMADAETFLSRNGHESTLRPGHQGLQRAGLNVRKASDAQHLEAIACAYACYIQIIASPMHASIMAELEAASGRKRSKATHDLHIIVAHFVSYGGDTPGEQLAARKLISRDVRAIQHLKAERVLPSRVQAFGAAPGEGLHAWARRSAARQPARLKPSANAENGRAARAQRRHQALIHEVVLTTRRPDGTRKSRSRFSLTGLLRSDIVALKRCIQRQSARCVKAD